MQSGHAELAKLHMKHGEGDVFISGGSQKPMYMYV